MHSSSSQTVSGATFQFPDYITCSSPVPRLYHVLPSSPQNLSRAPISPLATIGEVNYLYFHRLLVILLLILHQGGGEIHPDFFVKHDFEIAVDQKTKAHDRTFEGFRTPGMPAGQPRPSLVNLWLIFVAT